MWAITNRTPYKVGKTWGRDKDGIHEWVVAVKGTFDIKPDGSLKLADEQLEPLLLPEYTGEAGVSSLRYDADLVAPKPTTYTGVYLCSSCACHMPCFSIR